MTAKVNYSKVPVTTYVEKPESITVTMSIKQAHMLVYIAYRLLCGRGYYDKYNQVFRDIGGALDGAGIDAYKDAPAETIIGLEKVRIEIK